MADQIIHDLFQRRPDLKGLEKVVEQASQRLITLFRQGGTLLVCGNGGSAADADHICGELLKGFLSKRPLASADQSAFEKAFGEEGKNLGMKLQGGMRSIALTAHPALISAFANDVDPDLVYAQQVWAYGKPGDVLLGISTGGGAKNVLAALRTAKVKGMTTILLTGNRHGICESAADVVIAVPEGETYKIQEMHLPIYHALCAACEASLFGERS